MRLPIAFASFIFLSTTLFPVTFCLLALPPLLNQQALAAPKSPELAEADRLNQQVIQLYQQGKYAEAIPLAERALAIRERLLEDHPDLAVSLNNLAMLYMAQTYRSKAEPLLQRSLAIFERTSGDHHVDVAATLNNLAVIYWTQSRHDDAKALFQRSLSILEQQLGENHPSVAISLNNLAVLYRTQNRYSDADSLFQRSLPILEQQLGGKHLSVAVSLNNLANLYRDQNRDNDAESLRHRFHYILRQHQVEELYFKGLAAFISVNQSLFLMSQGVPWVEEPSQTSERINLTDEVNWLATQIIEEYERGKYAEAIDTHSARFLEIAVRFPLRENFLGSNILLIEAFVRLAEMSIWTGRYREAEEICDYILELIGHQNVATENLIFTVASLYIELGRYDAAETLYKQVSKNDEFRDSQRNLALLNLVQLYIQKGDQEAAKAASQQLESFYKKEISTSNSRSEVAIFSIWLANLYELVGRNREAEPLWESALVTFQESPFLSSDKDFHTRSIAGIMSSLASLYGETGRYGEAESLLKRALATRESHFGANDYGNVSILTNLALLYEKLGRYSEAELFFKKVLEIKERRYGVDRHGTDGTVGRLAHLFWRQGKNQQAIDFWSRKLDIEENTLSRTLVSGSEKQKREYIATLSDSTDSILSSHLQEAPTNPSIGRLALTTVLRRKGRILDVLGQSLQAIRQSADPQDKKLLDDLTAVRSQLSVLVYRGVGNTDPAVYRQKLQDLEAKSNQLEAQLNNRSASFRQQSQPVTIEAVQRLIPQEVALVEFVVYQPFNPTPPSPPLPRGGDSSPPSQGGVRGGEKWGNPRYAAYVLRATGEPQWVDLGEAVAIDQAVDEFRIALQRDDWSVDRIQAPGRKLDGLLMAPVRKLAGNATTLLISPDGQLNLIPFAALVDEQNRYLVETTTIAYLSSGRDLLRFQEPIASQQPPVILVNPNYDQPGDAQVALVPNAPSRAPVAATRGVGRVAGASSQKLSADMVNLGFAALDTSPNAPSMVPNLPGAVVLAQRQVTKQVVLGLQAPSLLHIHTHGFFLPDQPREQLAPGLNASEPRPVNVQAENPLVRSGLALAGANLSKTGKADGILTAFEVTGLNLFGTKLVVLSACETGLGSVANGEGVYGLRRAFVLAGAESLLMSLWKVDDRPTRELMTAYYKNLQTGMGRAEALRQVQLQMLQTDNFRPFYWAAFVPSGNWAPMGL